MPALEIVGGQTTAAGATLTALSVFTGNSLTVRNAPPGTDIRLLQAWVKSQATGILRLRGPEFHDNVQGLRLGHIAALVRPLIPRRPFQRLYAQQVITAELSGSAVAGDLDIAHLLLYYADLPGVVARLISAEDVLARMRHLIGVENTISTGVAGGWSGEEAINAEQDTFKANTDYALVGYITNIRCGAVRWRGVDTGNLGVGGPGDISDTELSSEWFLWLSAVYGLPLVPVFNSANKGSILIDASQDEDGADPRVTSIFAELAPG